ncbi:PEP-CTERM sorting domain-containing protein [Adhaeretor mobilis]|uniref:PEP-CTERM protein-sorting domain-containing protein n=1 Tax=Adhaeretor mobilis TaxID=1930276 RepID=A0A517N353_9BACT|nr:PEP-CTERM sorting domain-containing protein [Adhaeretor mobilis]QDT01567.1 hypothetical protein HG15A2_49140 [Adhaeretor mobilis]
MLAGLIRVILGREELSKSYSESSDLFYGFAMLFENGICGLAKSACFLLLLSLVATTTTQVAAFENLGFEATELSFGTPEPWYPGAELNPHFFNPDSPFYLDFEYGYFNPNKYGFEQDQFDARIVLPGWSIREELPDHSIVVPDIRYASFIDGHIGNGTHIVMTVNGRHRSALSGYHSLLLFGDFFSPSIPVAYQTGNIPAWARSVQIEVSCDYPGDYCYGGPVGDHFSLRLDGIDVPMVRVGPLDYLAESETYAGNIESFAGSLRELAIRPEVFPGGDFVPSMLLDNVSFSSSPAPEVPVDVPEPASTLLLVTCCVIVGFRRSRP